MPGALPARPAHHPASAAGTGEPLRGSAHPPRLSPHGGGRGDHRARYPRRQSAGQRQLAHGRHLYRDPPALAILAAKQLPPTGGDTLWASGIAALAALSPPLKTLLAGLEAEHDFTKSFPAHRHDGSEEERQRWQAAVARHPPLRHPVIRTHPVSGRQALFVNEGFTTRLPGLPPKESEALLGFLFEHITRPEFQVRWRWQENDIAIWDRWVTQHYANADYLPARRVMHRATILGDKPFWRPD
ncbi:TauD/TfdA family dioxygenase [Aeromonas taiwanensis]|uniref:TauD/TfdA family dioxygenase n=1 Tax=Aeromonas taiwanensis TaxID=633417 RepID=UPI003B9EFE56